MARALVLSGGGSKGAFEVGAVETLVSEQGLDFQVIAGVSAGALNAIVLAQGTGLAGLREQVEELKRIWFGISSNRDIYRGRFLGKALAFVTKDSIHDPTPLQKLIERYGRLDRLRASGREFRIGLSWLETVLYESIDQHHESLHACTLASSSIPLLFPPVRIGERSGVDGGVRNVTPLQDAFEALNALSPDSPSEPSEMVVVLASPVAMEADRTRWTTGLRVGKRALAMVLNEIFREDLLHALAINENVRCHRELRARLERELGAARAEATLTALDFPYAPPRFRDVRIRTIVPEKEFSDPLEFDPRTIREAFEAGRQAARNPLAERELAALLRGASDGLQTLAA